jgi:type IV pilus assembly protein PilX
MYQIHELIKVSSPARNDNGAVLIIALLVLMLVAVMGKFALTTSIMEKMISSNHRHQKQIVYMAEAGLESTRGVLQAEYTARNKAKIASGQSPDWDFALNGTEPNVNPALDTYVDKGAVWADQTPIAAEANSSGHYTVIAWNNPDDPGGAQDDTDGLIFLRSIATGPKQSQSIIEAVLLGQITGEPITGYSAQAGAGSGRNQNSRELKPISDFTAQ